MTTYVVEITQKDGKYFGVAHKGDRNKQLELGELQLSSDQLVSGHPKTPTLGFLCDLITSYETQQLPIFLGVRGQLELGRHLFDETIARYLEISGSTDDVLNPSELVELHIVTDDEFILRLPWVLIAHKSIFLSTCKWNVAFSSGEIDKHINLPINPYVLIIAPGNTGLKDTEAAAHLFDIEKELSLSDFHLVLGNHLVVAKSWQETQDALDERAYNLIYYYGHGEGNSQNSSLCFSSKQKDKISMALFAQKLKSANGQHGVEPQLIYINCCGGDAAGVLGAGSQLIKTTSAVISNRTTCTVKAARAFGAQLLRAVLVDGLSPHEAANKIYKGVAENDLRLSDIRWISPVLWREYGTWRANPPLVQDIDDPHWRLKLDRTQQFSHISYRMQLMLNAKQPRGLCYFWHGAKGQGVEIFHRRVPVELRELNSDLYVHDLEINWPDSHADNSDFEMMIAFACDCNSLDNAIEQMRAWAQQGSARNVLIYFHHSSIHKDQSKMLVHYLKWWDGVLLPKMKEANAYGLLGLSVQDINSARAANRFKQKVELDKLNNCVFNLLPELTSITKQDLLDFLSTHKIPIQDDIADELLDEILESCDGEYEKTLELLKDIIAKARDKAEKKQATKPLDIDNEDEWEF